MNETDDNLYNRPNLNWWEEIGQQHVPAHYVLWDVIHTRAIEIDLPVAYRPWLEARLLSRNANLLSRNEWGTNDGARERIELRFAILIGIVRSLY